MFDPSSDSSHRGDKGQFVFSMFSLEKDDWIWVVHVSIRCHCHKVWVDNATREMKCCKLRHLERLVGLTIFEFRLVVDVRKEKKRVSSLVQPTII
jgi:hypothetical protein